MKKQFSAEFKVKVAIEAIKGIKSNSEIAGAYGVHPTQIGFWKRQLIEGAPALFTDKRAKDGKTPERIIDELYKVIGQRDVEIEWMKKICSSWTHDERKKLIVPSHPDLSISRQAALLGISRASLYYKPRANEIDLKAMDAIDRIFTKCPFYGVPKMQDALRREASLVIGRDHTRRLLRLMGLQAIYPKKKTDFCVRCL